MSRSGVYTPETHQVTPMALRAEQVCSYDLDDMDQRWLTAVNGERSLTGLSGVSELEMERSMEELERQAASKMSSILKTNDDSDQLDDSVICDVCRSVRTINIISRKFRFIHGLTGRGSYNLRKTETKQRFATLCYIMQEPLKPRTNVSCRFLENQLAISFLLLTFYTAEVEWSE
jgi:hypothetical protein